MDAVIEVVGLTHRYESHLALNNLSFEVKHGEVFGLLGPNGAGKTTAVRLINGLFEATAGDITVLGKNPNEDGEKIRAFSGVLTETPSLYERLTARQNLRFFGTLAGLKDAEIDRRSDELLNLFGLSARADDRTGSYSKGMKQRLALARAWINHPRLLFLDEPTSGLDPEAAVQVRELIADVRKQEGATVLICTHNLDEAQRLCDRLLILREGTSLAQGTLTDLRKQLSPGLWLEIHLLEPLPNAETWAGANADVLRFDLSQPNLLRLEIESEQQIPGTIASLVNAGAQILAVQPQAISLEEVYLQLQNSQIQ